MAVALRLDADNSIDVFGLVVFCMGTILAMLLLKTDARVLQQSFAKIVPIPKKQENLSNHIFILKNGHPFQVHV